MEILASCGSGQVIQLLLGSCFLTCEMKIISSFRSTLQVMQRSNEACAKLFENSRVMQKYLFLDF